MRCEDGAKAVGAPVGRSFARLLLASGYVYSALAIVVQALVFPSVFSATGLLGAGAQAATWFWVWWHGGFPLFVIAYVLASESRPEDDSRRPIRSRYAGAIGIAIAAGIAALAYLTLRGTVALFSSLLDRAITLNAGGRYTIGWYVARFESLFTSTIVLLTLLGSIERILARLARLSRIDGLTGLPNRRAFDEELEARKTHTSRAKSTLSLSMISVDVFKSSTIRTGTRVAMTCESGGSQSRGERHEFVTERVRLGARDRARLRLTSRWAIARRTQERLVERLRTRR